MDPCTDPAILVLISDAQLDGFLFGVCVTLWIEAACLLATIAAVVRLAQVPK